MTNAVNIDSRLQTQTSKVLYRDGIPSAPVFGSTTTAAVVHKRPASVSNKPDAFGWRKPSAWSWDHVSFHLVPGSIRVLNSHFPREVTVYSGGYSTGSFNKSDYEAAAPTPPSNMENRAVIRALSKLKSQGVNFGVALAEASETADLVSSTITRIVKSVKVFRNARPKDWAKVVKNGARDQIKGIPQSWLELQYGWNPAMSDVNSACSQLSNRLAGKPPRTTVKATITEKFDLCKWAAMCPEVLQLVRYHGYSFCQVRLDYELDNLLLATFSSLGLTNPTEILWERTPFSFVVDWFLPIGPWMNVMDAAYGYNFLGGTVTKGSFVQAEAVSSVKPQASYYSSLGYHSSSYRRFSGDRAVYTTSPLPWIPGFKNPFSSGHVANAMSLLTQVFR